MAKLRFAITGAGFWAGFQLAAWREFDHVECVAICDLARERAEALAGRFGVTATYCDAAKMMRDERLDFVDVIADTSAHSELVLLASEYRLPVICQKPMAVSLAEAERMTRSCRAAGNPFFIHENWRWQRPIREVHQELLAGSVGRVFRARLQFSSSFPVFDNQPFIK